MMGYDEAEAAAREDESMVAMPATSPHDPLTYDPTQGKGTSAWQESVKRQMELNARLRRN